MAKYRVLIRGRKFMCAACGAIIEGANARNRVIACHESHSEPNPHDIPRLRRPRLLKDDREGRLFPDRYGHWRRLGDDNPEKKRIEYNKALYQASNAEKKEIAGKLRKLFNIYRRHNPKISPLKRLSYAFYFHNWEQTKQAAYALAYSEAVARRLEELNVPEILLFTLKLNEVMTEIAVRKDTISPDEARAEIQAAMNKFEVESIIRAIENGEFERGNDDIQNT